MNPRTPALAKAPETIRIIEEAMGKNLQGILAEAELAIAEELCVDPFMVLKSTNPNGIPLEIVLSPSGITLGLDDCPEVFEWGLPREEHFDEVSGAIRKILYRPCRSLSHGKAIRKFEFIPLDARDEALVARIITVTSDFKLRRTVRHFDPIIRTAEFLDSRFID